MPEFGSPKGGGGGGRLATNSQSLQGTRLQVLQGRFIRYAAEPEDSDEVRLRKTIGTAVILFSALTYVFYGLIYLAYDERPAALAALAGALICTVIAASYSIFRRYTLHWTAFIAIVALEVLAIHLLLGGFGGSAMGIIWLIAVPAVTIVADNQRRGLVWALVMAVLVIMAVVLEPYVARESRIPAATAITLSAITVIGLACYVLLAVYYYVWRIDVISRLVVQEREGRMRDLEAASRHKSEFLANMSHELRTPLNAILGFSEVLVEKMFGEVNEKQLDYLKDIHSSGQHLLSLINDILDLSKIEAGKMELQPSDFDLPEALQTSISLVKERAQRHGIALKLDVASDLGTIHADERKFKQIMLNLLSNAVKFTPEAGSIAVAAKTNGKMVEVSVADSGAGIAPEDHGAVFEEFRQVGGDAARKAEGTGLGLPLAKRFVELHGGQIRLESAPGQGSTFTFTIPLKST